MYSNFIISSNGVQRGNSSMQIEWNYFVLLRDLKTSKFTHTFYIYPTVEYNFNTFFKTIF